MSTATIPFSPPTNPASQAASQAERRASAARVRRQASRGRVALLMAALAIAFGGFALVGGPAQSTGAAHHAAAEQVVVEPGQTLWDIAQDVAPGEDTRSVIAEIVELNSLSSAGDIRAGQPLYVPEY